MLDCGIQWKGNLILCFHRKKHTSSCNFKLFIQLVLFSMLFLKRGINCQTEKIGNRDATGANGLSWPSLVMTQDLTLPQSMFMLNTFCDITVPSAQDMPVSRKSICYILYPLFISNTQGMCPLNCCIAFFCVVWYKFTTGLAKVNIHYKCSLLVYSFS